MEPIIFWKLRGNQWCPAQFLGPRDIHCGPYFYALGLCQFGGGNDIPNSPPQVPWEHGTRIFIIELTIQKYINEAGFWGVRSVFHTFYDQFFFQILVQNHEFSTISGTKFWYFQYDARCSFLYILLDTASYTAAWSCLKLNIPQRARVFRAFRAVFRLLWQFCLFKVLPQIIKILYICNIPEINADI